MRRTSYDDSCLPSDSFSRSQPARSRSLDNVAGFSRTGKLGDDIQKTVIRNRSEGDHLILNVRKFLEQRKLRQEELEREILSSRSLFDHRSLPPVPPPSPANARRSWKVRLVHAVRIVQHFFIPLQLGIVTALIWSNLDHDNFLLSFFY